MNRECPYCGNGSFRQMKPHELNVFICQQCGRQTFFPSRDVQDDDREPIAPGDYRYYGPSDRIA